LPAAGQKNQAFRCKSSESADALPAGFPLQSLAQRQPENHSTKLPDSNFTMHSA
jgi:hypothetical protein